MCILTIARHSWKSDIETNCKFLPPALIDYQSRMFMISSIIKIFSKRQDYDECKGDHCNHSPYIGANPNIVHRLISKISISAPIYKGLLEIRLTLPKASIPLRPPSMPLRPILYRLSQSLEERLGRVREEHS